ncbi:MAG: PP0621 family protein [Sulfurimonas sp.]|uniref:PP0621 family protein n=1 Tax=Sulfurimonas sp. TaxID=2022749 RepID=UPI002615EC16|nr:PP0621 family protein [Sulfurimonas sp.]MDD2652501.1 PP0621 family protein [Sulfurimonas sp.]MDD3452238.1 PP0621 family protein [Sulfurimonas sp.]
MIWKVLLVVGVIALVYFMFIKKRPQMQGDEKKDKPKSSDMVECATCGIYCALDDTIISNGKYYCSKECLEKIK